MLRKMSVVAVSLFLSSFAVGACATTVGVGFTNVGIHAGDGLNMSVPGGSLTAKQSLGYGYQAHVGVFRKHHGCPVNVHSSCAIPD